MNRCAVGVAGFTKYRGFILQSFRHKGKAVTKTLIEETTDELRHC